MTNKRGQRVHIAKGNRSAGTRVGIHVHRYAGYTQILTGEMTDYIQGMEVKKFGPGTGYYMPPCLPMSAVALGEDTWMIDIFIGPPGEPYIEILESAWPDAGFGA